MSAEDRPVRTEAAAPEPLEAPLTRGQRFRMVVKVIELRLRFIALMAATGFVFAYWDTLWNYYEKWTRPPGETHVAASDTEFFCPMHPTVVQAEPGNCPICGMPLSKRKKGEKTALPAGVTSRVALSALRVSQAGIETAEVGLRPLSEGVTTVGTVTFDERRLARISLRTKGEARVEKLFVNFTGTAVEAGQPLAEVFSPELYQAVQELLLAQKTAVERSAPRTALGRSLVGDGAEMVRLAREKLALWGVTPGQIDEILAKGQGDFRMPILSPIGGVVVRKNVVEGQYVPYGEAMFEVADLSHVWIQARVYEDQVGLVRVGQAVEATVPAYPGEVFRGTVAFKDPTLDAATRTLGVRYDLENPDGRLRPGMFATVTLKTPIAETPGFRDRIAKADGHAGHAATLTAAEQKICPVTTLKLGAMGDPVATEVQGRKIWTCCAACPPKLKAQPAKYLARLAAPPKDEVLTVPESAVIDTGMRKVVFVEAEPGVFEGREVVLGPASDGLYPVLDGLFAGEKVAAAGSFLLDAETRLKGLAGGPPAAAPAPASNSNGPMATRPADAGHRH